jgi:PAP2 superfamily.
MTPPLRRRLTRGVDWVSASASSSITTRSIRWRTACRSPWRWRAAGYLQKRYGWQWGLPATLAASIVGLSRVESRDHHWYDVVAGAALGEVTAYVFTTPRDSNVQFLPWADTHGAGVYVAAKF